MKLKYLNLFFVMALMFLVIGCSTNDNSQKSVQTTSTNTQSAPTATQTTSQSNARTFEIKVVPQSADPSDDVSGTKRLPEYVGLVDLKNVNANFGKAGLELNLKLHNIITQSAVNSNNFNAGTGLTYVITLAQMDNIYDDYNSKNGEADKLCQITVFSDYSNDGKYWSWAIVNNKETPYKESPTNTEVTGFESDTLHILISSDQLYSSSYASSYTGNKRWVDQSKNIFNGCQFEKELPVYLKVRSSYSTYFSFEDNAPDQTVQGQSVWYKVE